MFTNIVLMILLPEIVSQHYDAICKRLGFDQVQILSILEHVGSLASRGWADS